MTTVRAGLVVMTALTSLACDSSLDNHTGGMGTDAGAEVRGPPVPPPSCLLDLIATCPLAGACQYDEAQRFCFAGGETVSIVSIADGTAPQGGEVTEVRRSDGTLCYSIERRCSDPFCESNAYTWKDAAGVVVANGSAGWVITMSWAMATCEATGETCNVNYPVSGPPECVTYAVTKPTEELGCTQGSCP